MQERHLRNISLIVMVLGFIFLFFYADTIHQSPVEDIETSRIDEQVQLRGTISSLRRANNTLFLKVIGEKVVTTDIIFFPKDEVNLQENNYVEVTGTVTEYQGRKEIVADKVVVKS